MHGRPALALAGAVRGLGRGGHGRAVPVRPGGPRLKDLCAPCWPDRLPSAAARIAALDSLTAAYSTAAAQSAGHMLHLTRLMGDRVANASAAASAAAAAPGLRMHLLIDRSDEAALAFWTAVAAGATAREAVAAEIQHVENPQAALSTTTLLRETASPMPRAHTAHAPPSQIADLHVYK